MQAEASGCIVRTMLKFHALSRDRVTEVHQILSGMGMLESGDTVVMLPKVPHRFRQLDGAITYLGTRIEAGGK